MQHGRVMTRVNSLDRRRSIHVASIFPNLTLVVIYEFVSGNAQDYCLEMDFRQPASIEAYVESAQHVCALTYNYLDPQRIINSVQDDGAGATAHVKRVDYALYRGRG